MLTKNVNNSKNGVFFNIKVINLNFIVYLFRFLQAP
jgi:hypothetical protein